MAKRAYTDRTENPYDPKKSKGENFKAVLHWAFRLRSVALSLPVAVLAVILAVNNMAMLPAELVIGAGQSVTIINKSVLVMGPLALTALSILMTLLSKRVTYPWIISIFTLLLPLMLVITMSF